MNNKSLSLATLLTLLLAHCYLPTTASAQQLWFGGDRPCKSTEGILFELNVTEAWPVASDQVLVTGNVWSPQPLKLRISITVTMALAMVGGVREGSSRRIHLIKQSSDHEPKIETVIDLGNMMKGRAPDVKLSGGEIVYVSESCAPAKPNRPIDPVRIITPSVAEKPAQPKRRA